MNTNLPTITVNDTKLLEGMPRWAVSTVVIIGSISTLLHCGTELVREIKPLVQPFVNEWYSKKVVNSTIVADYYSEETPPSRQVEVLEGLSVL